jgi:outer membrane lipoprotein carrier protein
MNLLDLSRHLGFVLLLLQLPLPASSQSISPRQAVLNLETKFASLHSLQADFEQEHFSSAIATPLREKGKFYFERPDRMRWEYLDPEPKTYVYKEGLMLAYFPEDNQLYRRSLPPEERDSAIFSLLTGRAGIEQQYLVEAAEFPSGAESSVQVKLIPKEEGEYTYILLAIDRKSWLIRTAVFFDWAGNKQEFRFNAVKINPRLGPKTFEIKVPPDCEVIEDLPPVIK